MKKILLIIFWVFASHLFITKKIHSQCTVSDLAIELKTAVPVSQGCEVVFNFSWIQEVNAGNKFAYVHLWSSNKYPALEANGLAYSPTSNCPSPEDLADALATIVIDENGSDKPVIGTVYHPQSSVAVLSSGVEIIKENINATLERATIQNITLIVPNCSGAGITGDIWASQAENGSNVHCVSSNVNFVVGNPRVAGLMYCDMPRQYSVQINNIGLAPISVSYNVYADEGDGVYEPTHDVKVTATPVGPVAIDPGNFYYSPIQSFLPYSAQWPYYNNGLWVEVTTVGIPNKTLYYIDNTCIALPVVFTSFTAHRDGPTALLKWETSSESANSGFEVQRKTANGGFVDIAFVPSKAVHGNSNSPLSYSYNDGNNEKGISQYRIKQIDLDGNSKFSDIRIVSGLERRVKFIVYPNPSAGGQVKILFEEADNNYVLSMNDMNGRLIRKWSNLSVSYLNVDNVTAGIYLITLTDKRNGEKQIIKLVVMDK